MPLLEEIEKEISLTEVERSSKPISEYLNIVSNGASIGDRNNSLARLAGLLHSHNIKHSLLQHLLLSVNKSANMNLDDREVEQIAMSISKYPVSPQYQEPQGDDILTMAQCRDKWYELRKRNKSVITPWARLNDAIPYFMPGHVLTVAGRAGSLKSNLGIMMGHEISKALDGHVLFFSLEMPAQDIFFRITNMSLSKFTQVPHAANETCAKLDNDMGISNTIVKNYSNFLVVDKDSQSLDQIEKFIHTANKNYYIPVIVIDYMGYISGKGSIYEKTSAIAKEVKGLAKRFNVRIILICQASRESGDGYLPVKLNHMRDSGAIEESADHILGMWHGVGEKNNRIHCEVLKVRNGKRHARFDFINNGFYLEEDDFREDKDNKPVF